MDCTSYIKISGAYAEIMEPHLKVGGSYIGNCLSLYKKVSGAYEAIWHRQIDYGSYGWTAWSGSPFGDQWWVSIPDWYTGSVEWVMENADTGVTLEYGTPSADSVSLVDDKGVTRSADAGHYIVMSPRRYPDSYPSIDVRLGFRTPVRGDIGIVVINH